MALKMVELKHDVEPNELTDFVKKARKPILPSEFNSHKFISVKQKIKTALHNIQEGYCVYCERQTNIEHGHVEHIKSKDNYRDLCFTYTNFAFSCTNSHQSCGMKKDNCDLPIMPSVNCNKEWFLDTNGEITGAQNVMDTVVILGLNEPGLCRERRTVFNNVISIMKKENFTFQNYLDATPKTNFKFIISEQAIHTIKVVYAAFGSD